MTTPWKVLVQALSEAALAFARQLSPTSTNTSPPPSTTQETSPAPDPMSMMTMMREMLREERQETRRLVLGLVYPQISTPTSQNGSSPIQETSDDPWQEYDQMALSPELEAVTRREAEETEVQRSLKERAVLQGRLREKQQEYLDLLEQSGSDPGPWQGASAEE
jgi:hypothetical protein